MESEALTALLNSYLDEMSSIALEHGGTIDKFIGDAIMVFGDPESLGEKEDALACVKMAIAMREAVKGLRRQWRNQGGGQAPAHSCGHQQRSLHSGQLRFRRSNGLHHYWGSSESGQSFGVCGGCGSNLDF